MNRYRIFVLGLCKLVLLFVLAGCSDGASVGSKVTGADPGVLEAPIAFVRRPIALDEDGDERQSDLREPLFFVAGGDLFIRSNSTVTASEINVTAGVTAGQGDVKDLQPSFDGRKLLFSLRLFDPNPNDDDTPTWDIYEYDLETGELRRIIADELTAGQGDDIDPAYLPDGRIVFSSNRQRQSGEVLTNEGKPRFRALEERERTQALVLHVMNDDGSEIHQISFNPSHDLDPVILTHTFPGQILYTRWDNAANRDSMHLYRMPPDGTDVQVHYGVHSHASGVNNTGENDVTIQFTEAQEMEDGRLAVIARPYANTYDGGDIVIIDAENFANNYQPVASMSGLAGPAQQSATINPVSTEAVGREISPGGRYRSVYPLWDGSNRLLISKSTCEIEVQEAAGTGSEPVRRPCIEPYLSEPNIREVLPVYSLWLYDLDEHVQKVIVRAEEGMVISDIVALQSRVTPDIIFDKSIGELDAGWRDQGLGAIHIQSVYDFGDGGFSGCFFNQCTSAAGIDSVSDLADPAKATAEQRPARFVRFVKAVPLADDDDPDLADAPNLARAAFGPQRNQAMREIIGYAPVEPDGSVKVKVPANVPLAISVLDNMGRRLSPRHLNWFQVRPGDTMECTGCHTTDTRNDATPNIHHRRDAEPGSINAGIPATGVFPNTLIPGTSDAYWGNLGETMAAVRFRLANNEPEANVDLVYEDYWTDTSVRPADTAFSFEYGQLDTALPTPATAGCDPWSFKCRIIINYPQHIHPLWSLPRSVDLDGDMVEDDATCTTCHANSDGVVDMVPAGQLDLGDGVSDLDSRHFKSYRELITGDQEQELDEQGTLQNVQIEVAQDNDNDGQQDTDEDGMLLFVMIDDPDARVAPTMSANGARASFFIEKMTETELDARRDLNTAESTPEYVDHSAMMTGHELKLISEWLDIGAQYFNNPFDPAVPLN